MRQLLLRLAPLAAVLLLLMAALWLAADAESARSRLGTAYVGLFAVAAVAVAVLVAAVSREAWHLFRQWHRGEPGGRLNARFALLICALAILPALLVSGFAMRFVNAGIDSWFRVDVARSQTSAEALGREVMFSFERRSRDLTAGIAHLEEFAAEDPQDVVDRLVADISDPIYVSLYDGGGNLQAIGFNTSAVVLPPAPSDEEQLQVREAGQLAINERINGVLVWRVLDRTPLGGTLQAIYPLPADIAPRLDLLERNAVDYAQLGFQRTAMKSTFVLILGLVALLSLLGSLYAAFAATRRLVQPIANLARATAEIAEGHYGRLLPAQGKDEIGFLTDAFNRMSTELLSADLRERGSRAELEQSRAHLAAVLERLSAGVISFTTERIITANPAAYALLDLEQGALEQHDLAKAILQFPRAAPLLELCSRCAAESRAHWREEVRLDGEPSRALLVRGTLLDTESEQRFVSVFDDAAVIANSQREAAWAEVAKRLAHEIKNPLTPIQLAAERLRHKYLGKMNAADAEVLDRSTQTIVAQVEALKRIVNAFGDYTRPTRAERQSFDLRLLVEEVIELYEQSGQCRILRTFGSSPVVLNGNRERLRQALVNLLTNAIEASETPLPVEIEVLLEAGDREVSLSVRDHGSGLPEQFDQRWFEPYNTTKVKGTGLGLATVKKVVEEHGGRVDAHNAEGGGACFVIVLPMNPQRA